MITINDIKFTPRSDCTYKYDYVDLATIIATPSRWGEKIPAEYLDKSIHPEVDTGWVARAIWRQVILNDLWFIMYFILGIPDSICNTPFVLKQCRVVEDGPKTDTLDIWARGHSKAIDISEPVPVPGGWKNHGDLVPGDYVYSPNGRPVMVTAKTPVFLDAECYRIHFDTGYSIVASGDHLWTVEISHKARINKTNTRIGYKTVTMSTIELLQELGKSKGTKTRILPRIPVSLPIANRPIIYQKSRYRRIYNIEKVSSIPVSCVQVDSPDGLYLVGKEYITTHNSSIITKAETIQYHLLFPDHCTIIFSFNKPTAESFVKSIKEAYEMPFLISCFPDVLYQNPKTEASSWSVQNGIVINRKNNTRTEATVMASGLVEGMLTGKHAERRVYDDFETADLARTPEQLNLCYSQFEMSSYLGTKTDRDIVRLIGTIYSHMGPIVKLKDKKDSDGNSLYNTRVVPGTVGGQWDGKPVFWSQKILNFEKTQAHYAMQVLCDPTPSNLRSFKSECLIEVEPGQIPKNILKFMIVDPAGDNANGKSGDCWAVPVIGIDMKQLDELGGANIYITNALITPMGKDAAVEEIARLYMSSACHSRPPKPNPSHSQG